MRRAHLLRRLKAQPIPSRVVIVDTETKPYEVAPDTTQNILWFGWAMYIRRHKDGKWSEPQWFRFTKTTDFWDWVTKLVPDKTTLYMFAHNLSFDEQVMMGFTEMDSRGWDLNLAILEEPPSILQWSNGTQKILWLDTLNWFLMSLERLGEEVGIPKLDMPVESPDMKEWDTYCRRDVDVLRVAILAWFDRIIEWDLGGFKMTLASQAFTAFRYKFLNHKLYIHADEETLELERQSYYGGRTEAYFIGKLNEPVFVLDVNSMYPAVMQDNEFPRWHISTERRPSHYDLQRMLRDQAVTADVLLDTDEPAYPTRHNGKLIFPVGRFRTALSTPELKYALEAGHITTIYQAAVYDTDPIFRDYVVEMYARRQEAKRTGDTVQNLHTKLMLNSLYGKFGQRGYKWEPSEYGVPAETGVFKMYNMDTGKTETYRSIAGNVFQEIREGESHNSFPAISAHVTAAARMVLWKAIKLVGHHNMFYCDTDSMVLTAEGFQIMKQEIDETQLGAWSLDYTATSAEFYGAKDYIVGERRKHKGIKYNAVQIGPNVYVQDHFRKIIGGLRRGEIDRQLVVRIRKTLHRNYDKGVVGPDGWVSPIRLGARA